jgi:single-stranded DNA-binding protein
LTSGWQYLKKGSAVLVEGRLQMREMGTARGEKRQRLEVRADAVHILERGGTTGPGAPAAEAGAGSDPSDEGSLF